MLKGMLMSKVYLKNKKSNITYVYECVSFWNKKTKRPDSSRTCIGKIDPETGNLIPSKRLTPEQAALRDPAITASAEIVGAPLIFLHLSQTVFSCIPDYVGLTALNYIFDLPRPNGLGYIILALQANSGSCFKTI